MNLKVHVEVIPQMDTHKTREEKKHYFRLVFSIVDMDKAKDYPANYLCILPLNVSEKCRFVELFGKDVDLLLRLLNEALENREYSDKPYIVADINRRIQRLIPNVRHSTCRQCGKDFEYKPFFNKRRFICDECKAKSVLEQAKKQQINPNLTNLNLPARLCLFCNKEFTAIRSTKKYCNVSCYNKAKWQRRKQVLNFPSNKPKPKRYWLPKNVRDAYA